MAVTTEELVEIGTSLRSSSDSREAPTVQLAGERRVLRLLAAKELRKNALKRLLLEDRKSTSMREPGNDARVFFVVKDFHQLQKGEEERWRNAQWVSRKA